MWIGWNGLEHRAGETLAVPPQAGAPGVRYRAVPLSSRDVAAYYRGFSNRTIWPLFHYFVGRTRIDTESWPVYDRVNARFAEVAAAESTDDDLVWVHDYQLLRTAHHLRKLAPGRRIAFFLHIPFPAVDVFRVLPWARAVVQGMLAADLVGFHVPSYAEHFLQAAERLLGSEVDRRRGVVRVDGREVSVGAHPIGVDAAQLEQLADRSAKPSALGRPRVAEVLGVDRLDYTKGVHERLLAVERLFEHHPEYRGRVVFTQLLVPSRERIAEYGDLKREIDETVGRVNGRFSEHGWSPIRYLVRSLAPADLTLMYRQSDVALVTPLRDGMNLVSKEYVASRTDNGGMLVLSELAGAAEELHEALLVNPFDIDAVAEAIHLALSMSEEERRVRMSALRDRVRTNDVHAWVRGFLAAAERASARVGGAPSILDHVRRRLGPWLAQRPDTVLFLDYDGTLTELAARPEDARLSERARRAIRQAVRNPGVDVAIVSTRPLTDVQQLVGIEGITYVANHGFEIEGPGLSFRHSDADRHSATLDAAARELEALEVEGAWVERRGVAVAYHLREVSDEGRRVAERRAASLLRRRRLHVVLRRRVVEGRPRVEWDKGRGVLRVLTHRYGVEWPTRVRAIYVGDDETDVDAFRALRGIGRSIYVAERPSRRGHAADLRLSDPDAVLQLLRWIAARAFAEPPA